MNKMGINLKNISKKFGQTTALKNISLKIKSGSFFSLMGPTGHGKTTLLRIVAGVETPDEGKIYFDGEDVTDVDPQDRNLSMVYQDFALYQNLNVFENIASPLVVSDEKISEEEIEEKVQDVADMLGISELLDRRITDLSGGEQQRTALARALVKERDLILLDEPLTNLDYKLREKMRKELSALEMGTVIHATSEPLTAMSMCTDIGIIYNGQIHQAGDSEEVYYNPRKKIVGSLYSHSPMNFLNAKLIQGPYLKASEEIEIDVSSIEDTLDKEEYFLGIRPNDIQRKKDGDMIKFSPTVKIVETKGSESTVHLSYQETAMRFYKDDILDYDLGEEIELYFDPKDVYIYDGSSETLVAKGSEPKNG